MDLPVRTYGVFEDFYRPFESLLGLSPSRDSAESRWMPRVDIVKNEKDFTLTMDVPGFVAKDLNVEAHDGILSIEGERSQKKEISEGQMVRRERYLSRFSRRFSLPKGAGADHIAASVKNGELVIVIPHDSSPEPKRITVR